MEEVVRMQVVDFLSMCELILFLKLGIFFTEERL